MTFRILTALAAMTILGACGGAQQEETTPEPESEPMAEAETATEEAVAEVTGPTTESVRIENDHIVIDRKIHFETGSATIAEDSNDLIAAIADLLRLHGEIATLHVVGHTDNTGDHDFNVRLSEQRAQAVVDALSERGVTTNMDARGAGPDEPVCGNDTDNCRALNRRVEMIIETAN